MRETMCEYDLTEKDISNCIIWGCGRIGKMIIKMLKTLGISEIVITDNSAALWGTTIEGNEVVPGLQIMAQTEKYRENYLMVSCIPDSEENFFIHFASKYMHVISWKKIVDFFAAQIKGKEMGYNIDYKKGLRTWWFGLESELDFWENAYAMGGGGTSIIYI